MLPAGLVFVDPGAGACHTVGAQQMLTGAPPPAPFCPGLKPPSANCTETTNSFRVSPLHYVSSAPCLLGPFLTFHFANVTTEAQSR